jgi:hypothetical protein
LYNVNANFISREAFTDFVISCHQVIHLIRFHRDFLPNTALALWRDGSDSCEQLFSTLGGFGSVGTLTRTWSAAEAAAALPKIMATKAYASKKENPLVLSRRHRKQESVWGGDLKGGKVKPPDASRAVYPSENNLKLAVNRGIHRAVQRLWKLGVRPAAFDGEQFDDAVTGGIWPPPGDVLRGKSLPPWFLRPWLDLDKSLEKAMRAADVDDDVEKPRSREPESSSGERGDEKDEESDTDDCDVPPTSQAAVGSKMGEGPHITAAELTAGDGAASCQVVVLERGSDASGDCDEEEVVVEQLTAGLGLQMKSDADCPDNRRARNELEGVFDELLDTQLANASAPAGTPCVCFWCCVCVHVATLFLTFSYHLASTCSAAPDHEVGVPPSASTWEGSCLSPISHA